MLMEEDDDNNSTLNGLEEEGWNIEEEEDVGEEEGFKVHEGTRFRSQRRQLRRELHPHSFEHRNNTQSGVD